MLHMVPVHMCVQGGCWCECVVTFMTGVEFRSYVWPRCFIYDAPCGPQEGTCLHTSCMCRFLTGSPLGAGLLTTGPYLLTSSHSCHLTLYLHMFLASLSICLPDFSISHTQSICTVDLVCVLHSEDSHQMCA